MINQLRSVLKFLPLALLLALPLALGRPATAEPAEPLSPEAGPNWSSIVALTDNSLSSAPYGAERPVVAVAPNGNTVMVAYLKRAQDATVDADPFFRVSHNHGATWAPPQAIKDTPTRARQVDLTFGANSVAHAIWTEANKIVAYARQSNWGVGTYTTISTALVAAEGPRIVASGSNRLDAVWAHNGGADFDIYHAFSTNSNAANPTWTVTNAISVTPPASTSPDIAVDANGHIHVVWEEQQDPSVPGNDPTKARVFYARSTNGGSSWSNPIAISNRGNPTDARRPRIIAFGNRLHVSFTDNEGANDQFVHHLVCAAADCTVLTNWVSSGKVSGGKLGIRTVDPADIISTLTRTGACTFVYFHGIDASLDANNEMIWGVSNCDNWGQRVRLTPTGTRAIKPSMAAQNNWWVYLAYERVTTIDRQINFVRNKPAIYLPFIRR